MLSSAGAKTWTRDDIDAFLPLRIEQIKPGPIYRVGLVAVAGSLIILQALYLAMVILAGYATYRYLLLIPAIFSAMHVNVLTIVLAVTPAAAGILVTFFLLKPLLAKAPVPEELIHLDPETEPILFAFVRRICQQLGAPSPKRIDVDLRVNASASLRLGWRSLFSNDLVLTIGLPLVAGLDVRQFGAILAHEFGHFSQHAGMRLYFLIVTIRHWFHRVANERDRWDDDLDDWRSTSGWRLKLILNIGWATVQASRSILRGLLHCANIVSAWFSRQMEFDADQHAAALTGGETFGQALSLLPVLEVSAQTAWNTASRAWQSQRLCDDFVLLVRHRTTALDEETRNQIVAGDSEEITGRWSSHPSKSDRIARVTGQQGASTSETALAETLFCNFSALCQKVTLDHYKRLLGDSTGNAQITPARDFIELTSLETRRAEALEGYFGLVTKPARWFLLPEGALVGDLKVFVCLEDETARYWSLLDQSLHQNAALEFLRAGGKINPASFHLSSSDLTVVEKEACESRLALRSEIARLRERFSGNGHLLKNAPDEWRDAYRAISAAQDDFLELWQRLIALRLTSANIRFLADPGATQTAQAEIVRNTCRALLEKLSHCSCPPLTGNESRTLAELLRPESENSDPEVAASHILEQADYVGNAILGELCAICMTSQGTNQPGLV